MKYNYPEPRAPSYEEPASIEDCIQKAKIISRKKGGRTAMGTIEEGDCILVLSLPDQDEYVERAIMQACEVEGADMVRFLYPEELTGETHGKSTVEEGWREAEMFENGIASGSPETADLASGLNIAGPLREFLDDHPNYNKIYWDIGARSQKASVLERHSHKFKNNWQFNNWEEFQSRTWDLPDELLIEIERKIIDVLGDIEEVTMTDPQGTDLRFELTPDEAARWQMTAWQSGHLYMDPLQATCVGECRGGCRDEQNQPIFLSQEAPPVFGGATGTISGTANHAGFFPHMDLTFEEGKLVRVEGGGEYGRRIEALREKYENVHWPGYPRNGFFWHCDTALCTLPKAFRRTSDMFESSWRFPNLPETTRAGVIHFGFGSRRHYIEEHLDYAAKNNLPLGHIHVHNYFVTMDMKRRSTGDWNRIIDKGRLTALDHPDIRSLATKYGNPDDILSYDWVPPIPGVNCEGDYEQDYAEEPVRYLRSRLEAGEPI